MKSMTAFANLNQTFDWGQCHWEIRSVNQRYLELNFRLPDLARSLEMPLRELCKRQLMRGKLDIGLKLELNQTTEALSIQPEVLNQLSQAICQIQQSLPEATQVNPVDLLNWPGLVQKPVHALEQLSTPLLNTFESALEQLNQTREREGQHLASMLEQRCLQIQQHLSELKPLLPEILNQQQQRLRERIAELSATLDESRLAMELAIMAQKADIAEELDRLTTHLEEVQRVMTQSGAIGRRLDFLMQELNREANTLGAKSIDVRSTQVSVELKVLIEQMREQVQNIE